MHEILFYLTLECYSATRSVVLPSFMANSLSFADIETIKISSQVTSVSINPDPSVFSVDYLDEQGNCLGRQKIL